jgi:hypothetical protein
MPAAPFKVMLRAPISMEQLWKGNSKMPSQRGFFLEPMEDRDAKVGLAKRHGSVTWSLAIRSRFRLTVTGSLAEISLSCIDMILPSQSRPRIKATNFMVEGALAQEAVERLLHDLRLTTRAKPPASFPEQGITQIAVLSASTPFGFHLSLATIFHGRRTCRGRRYARN